MKILYVTTIGGTMRFFETLIKGLIAEGHTVDIATNTGLSPVPSCYEEWGCRVFRLSCTRSPFNANTFRAVKELKKIVKENGYDIVHCHTPIAAMCTRLACRKARKSGTRVIYTAHGFHFYKGAPKKNWVIYYPVEWTCSFMTDTIININKEDFKRATKRMHAKSVQYVPGVGIETSGFSDIKIDRAGKREELGIPKDCVAVLSVGELNDNKNHEIIIRAIAANPRKDIYYVICGKGGKAEYLENLAKELGMGDRLILAGFRRDVSEIYRCCDLFAFPSFREGLSVSLMEAMCSGLPVMCSGIRGNVDLIEDGIGGFLFNPNSLESVNLALNRFLECVCLEEIVEYNKKKLNEFSMDSVNEQMLEIYGCKKE